MNIYVGNLSHEATEDDLREVFKAFGEITSINIIKDKFSGESKGFGFIEMPGKQEAKTAINDLNGTQIKGRTVTVNEAKPRTDRRGGPGGGGRQQKRGSWQNRF